MRDQTTRMTRLVSDLLSLSKLDEQDQPPTETVNLADIIAAVIRAMELRAAQRSITIESDLGLELYLCGDYRSACFRLCKICSITRSITARLGPDPDRGAAAG